jgi:sugar diacid utilization regulator
MGSGMAIVTEQAVLDRITARRDELARRMTDRILVEVEEYSHADVQELVPGVEANCRAHVDGFLRYVTTGTLPVITSGGALAKPTIDRVRQGIRLDAYLHAFRVGQDVFWEEILRETRDDPAAALEFARPSMRYIDSVCNRMAQLYLQASQRLHSEDEQADRDLLEALLAGAALDASQVRRVASLGIGSRSLIALLQRASDSSDSTEDSLRLAADRALRVSGTSGLVVRRHRMLVVVIGLGDDMAAAVVEALRSALDSESRCGISAEADRIRHLGRAHEQALAALRRTTQDRPVVALTEAGAYDYLIFTAGSLLDRMVAQDLLAAIDPDTPDGAGLAETARAYLDADLSIREASARLFIHPNTLRYRLGQLENRAGISVKRFADLVELRIALDLTQGRRSWSGGEELSPLPDR